jgi:hypothetical protein
VSRLGWVDAVEKVRGILLERVSMAARCSSVADGGKIGSLFAWVTKAQESVEPPGKITNQTRP